MSKKPSRNQSIGSYGYFRAIQDLVVSAFPKATIGQRAAIVAMSFLVVMFMAIAALSGLPPLALVGMFLVATLFIVAIAALLVLIETTTPVPMPAPSRCCHIPIFPPTEQAQVAITNALEEVRQDAANELVRKISSLKFDEIRANIFLLAEVAGGGSHGKWKLVIWRDFSINMSHPAECQLQFAIGQGATGVAYRDGKFQLTRRQPSDEGQWDVKLRITPELQTQVHKRLKWIVSFPLLLKGTTNDAIGVLNIDGLVNVSDDDTLLKLATELQPKVHDIATLLSLQPFNCVGLDQLGVMENV